LSSPFRFERPRIGRRTPIRRWTPGDPDMPSQIISAMMAVGRNGPP
jgi:hypothetical protein